MYKKFVTWAKNYDYDHRIIVGIGIAVVFFTLSLMIAGNSWIIQS
jgi:hypothetical protein